MKISVNSLFDWMVRRDSLSIVFTKRLLHLFYWGPECMRACWPLLQAIAYLLE
jgi:hypothetical protein